MTDTQYAKAETLVVDDIESWHGYTLDADGDWDDPTICTTFLMELKDDFMVDCKPNRKGFCDCYPTMFAPRRDTRQEYKFVFPDLTYDTDLRF